MNQSSLSAAEREVLQTRNEKITVRNTLSGIIFVFAHNLRHICYHLSQFNYYISDVALLIVDRRFICFSIICPKKTASLLFTGAKPFVMVLPAPVDQTDSLLLYVNQIRLFSARFLLYMPSRRRLCRLPSHRTRICRVSQQYTRQPRRSPRASSRLRRPSRARP